MFYPLFINFLNITWTWY